MRPYLELLRPANLATAAADILAGSAVAGRFSPWLLLSTVCLYGGGVVLNDYFDRSLDSVERPERPIPSGRVSATAAARFGFGLLILGGAFSALLAPISAVVAACIALFVLLYDAAGKHPLAVATCRALNLLLGISAVPSALAENWWLALLPFVYITGVTFLSRGEVHGGNRATVLFSLLCVLSVLAGSLLVTRSSLAGGAIWILFAWRVLPPFWRAYQTPQAIVIRGAVKAGVLSLVILDAVIAAAYGGPLYGLLVLSLASLAGFLARLFAVT